MLRTCLLGLGLISCLALLAQGGTDRLGLAKTYYEHGKYTSALNTLTASRPVSRLTPEEKLVVALCQFQLNRLNSAEPLLRELAEAKRMDFPEALLFLAMVYHHRNQFAEASRFYKNYLRTLRADDADRRMVIEQIRRCDNGLRLLYRERRVVVDNLGSAINTEGDEFAPLISPLNHERLYFSALRNDNVGGLRNAYGQPDANLGQPRGDMFVSRLERANWLAATPLHYLLNSNKHEIALDFSADGRVLYYYQGWNMEDGIMLADSFPRQEERTLRTNPLSTPLQVREGDGTPFFFNDTLIVFSSRRSGGFGGLDLYKSSRRNGRWTAPENLGPVVNSAYDETTPYLAPDGRTLYFSTNDSYRSVGGFDVVKSFFIAEEKRWTQAESLGIPINSAGEETYFRLLRDGFTAFMASSRKEGQGQRDIYVVYFQDFQEEVEPPLATAPKPALKVAPPPATQPPREQPARLPPPVADSSPSPSSPVITPAIKPAPADTRTQTPPPTAPRFVFPFPGMSVPTDGATLHQLDEALGLLRQNAQLRLVITAYVPGTANGMLFDGIRRSESVGAYLLQRGITGERLFQRAVVRAGAPSQVALTFSQPGAGADLGALPVIGRPGSVFGDAPYNRELLYKVQVVSVKQSYQDNVIQQFDHQMIETWPGFDFYRYTVGAFATHREAAAYRDKVVAAGVKGPYVAAYYQGLRLQPRDAQQLQTRFPDLRNFLEQ